MSNKDKNNNNDSDSDDSYENECYIDNVLHTQEVIGNQNELNEMNDLSVSNMSYNPQKFLKNKIFSLEGIERRKDLFYLNLIHYDENMKNIENIDYYKRFKLNVVGGFHGIDNFEILKKLIDKIKKNPHKIHYILVTSGSASEKILSYCHDLEFIKEFLKII